MKILFTCVSLRRGGAERVINLLSNHFAQSNDVVIVANDTNDIEYDFNKKIVIEPLFNGFKNKKINRISCKLRKLSLLSLFKLKKVILKHNPDIIVSFLPEPNFRVLALKKFSSKIRNIPIIISVRNDPNTEYNNYLYFKIMKMLYPLSNQMVLQTEDAKKYFIDKIGYTGSVIHNPVDQQFLVKRYSGLRDKRIVAVGRLEPQKNYFNLIAAFEIVSKVHPDYILEIYGDGKLKESLKKCVDENGLTDKIFLRGKVKDIKDKLYKASVFVMSSNYEGMPNALLEASCLGVPCVSTDCPCGGPREILKKGQCGILVELNNPQELAKGINYLIENEKKSNELSSKAQENWSEYSTLNIVKEWEMEIKKQIK